METLKTKLKEMRKIARLNRPKLAEISGYPPRLIETYENNQAIKPKADYLEFCSLYFGYTLESITNDKKELEKMKPNEQILKIFARIHNFSNADFFEFLYFVDYDRDEYAAFLSHKNKLSEWQYIENIDANFKANTNEQLRYILEWHGVKIDDYTADKYAEYIKAQNEIKSNGIKSSIDFEILELLKNASDSKKKAIIELLKGGG